MNNCKTINEYRDIILDRCQDCEFLIYCMYDICIIPTFRPDYLSVSLTLEYLDLYF